MRAARQLILVLALGAGSAQAAEVWRWTDAEGVVRYGQVPPTDAKAERLSIKSRPSDPKGVIQELASLELRSKTNTLEAELSQRVAAEQAAKAEARAKACTQAMTRYESLLSSRRIFIEGAKGEETVASGEEAEAYKEAARKKVEELCAS
jgi:hypothetical protein